MKVMLTGATGNLGNHITNQAIEHNLNEFYIGVRNLDKIPEDWKAHVTVRQLNHF